MDGGAYTYENTEPENNIDNQIVIVITCLLKSFFLLPSPGQVFLPFFYCKTDMHPSELRVFKLSPTSFFLFQKALWISYLEKYYELHAKDVSLEGIDLKKYLESVIA